MQEITPDLPNIPERLALLILLSLLDALSPQEQAELNRLLGSHLVYNPLYQQFSQDQVRQEIFEPFVVIKTDPAIAYKKFLSGNYIQVTHPPSKTGFRHKLAKLLLLTGPPL